MNGGSVRRRRLLHSVILTMFIIVVLVQTVRERIPYWEFALAVGYLWVWMLGIRYERHVVVQAELASREEVKRAEQAGSSWFNWKRMLGRE